MLPDGIKTAVLWRTPTLREHVGAPSECAEYVTRNAKFGDTLENDSVHFSEENRRICEQIEHRAERAAQSRGFLQDTWQQQEKDRYWDRWQRQESGGEIGL